MNKNLYLILSLTCTSLLLQGQDYAFKVLANKGTNEVKSGDAWMPLKTGATLKTGDEVKLADNAYIGLVHASGKPMEIKVAGSYKVTDLAAKVSGGSSVLNKYTDFILSSNSAEAKKNRLSATGAVHRGETYAIQLMLPENQNSVYNNIVVINWEGTKVAGPYIVTLRNMFDEELVKAETNETSFKIDLTESKLATEDAIWLEVKAKNDEKQISKKHLIKRLTSTDTEQVKTSLNEIMGEVADQTALNKLILAGFYEENNLFIDAITAYEDAIKLAPEVPSYKDAYEEFLLRRGIKK